MKKEEVTNTRKMEEGEGRCEGRESKRITKEERKQVKEVEEEIEKDIVKWSRWMEIGEIENEKLRGFIVRTTGNGDQFPQCGPHPWVESRETRLINDEEDEENLERGIGEKRSRRQVLYIKINRAEEIEKENHLLRQLARKELQKLEKKELKEVWKELAVLGVEEEEGEVSGEAFWLLWI